MHCRADSGAKITTERWATGRDDQHDNHSSRERISSPAIGIPVGIGASLPVCSRHDEGAVDRKQLDQADSEHDENEFIERCQRVSVTPANGI